MPCPGAVPSAPCGVCPCSRVPRAPCPASRAAAAPVELAGGASRDPTSARRGETRRKHWIWGLESIRGTLRSHSPKRVEIVQGWGWKGLLDFPTRPGAVPLTWRWEGLGSISGCWQSRGAGDPLLSRGAPRSHQRGLLLLPRACWTEDVCELLEGLRMPPPPCTMDGAAQQKSGAPAFEDETMRAFSLPALRVPNCLLDLAPATAETFALPGRSCIWR